MPTLRNPIVLPQYGQGMKIDTVELMNAQIKRMPAISGRSAMINAKPPLNDSQNIILSLLYFLNAS